MPSRRAPPLLALIAPASAFITMAMGAGIPLPASAQVPLTMEQLERLVAPIALYPDPLLAQVLTASTHADQIQGAELWADQHSYLKGAALADAMLQDSLEWDPAVQALLPFPDVLTRMAANAAWTRQLGEAAFSQQIDTMEAVQQMRQRAVQYGYLEDSHNYKVLDPGPDTIAIMPADPDAYFVPYYDPRVVFSGPSGSGAAIRFGPAVMLGAAFTPWGWDGTGFAWTSHTILTRPYGHEFRRTGPRTERHALRPTR